MQTALCAIMGYGSTCAERSG